MTTPTPAPAGEGAKVPPDWAVKAACRINEINALRSIGIRVPRRALQRGEGK